MDLTILAPSFERVGPPGDSPGPLKVVHQDFHGLVNFSDPAQAGETVHLYLTGLGDVQPRPPTGSPPMFLTYANQRPTCLLSSPLGQQELARVDFAGLAPGMIGIYQMDVTIPEDYRSSPATLRCFDTGAQGALVGDSGDLWIAKQ
jgi:uncharacterized protein (TIGR03437 family)